MGVMGIWQWVIVLAIVLLLFGGRGKISALMGDFGSGLKSFKKGLKDEDDDSDDKKAAIEDKPAMSEETKSEDKDKAS
ncbi:MAG: twin-arginine translocase TatA/TatE family subunit [Rhodospirillaceae bacterium]|nr:MAG: twin-arginine translocase TatA/TatE family subunit [Rhodospirillaceae bacterium]